VPLGRKFNYLVYTDTLHRQTREDKSNEIEEKKIKSLPVALAAVVISSFSFSKISRIAKKFIFSEKKNLEMILN